MNATPRRRRALSWAALGLIAAAGLGLRFAAIGRPFWMDESFSSALAAQEAPTIVYVCRKDVHPPGYYLALRLWNRLWRAALRSHRLEEEWRLLDFNLGAIETAGVFEWAGPGGARLSTAGVFPDRELAWDRAPLAPLWALRTLSVVFGAAAAWLCWGLGRLILLEWPSARLLAVAMFAFSGFSLTWDTVIRSYSAATMLIAALALTALWGARTGRWRVAGPAVAALAAAAFLTNYVTILHFPGIVLAAWLWGGANRRTFLRICGAFLAAGAICAGLWGGAFFEQTGRVPSQAFFAQPIAGALGREFHNVSLHYWSQLFSEGMWRWLLAGGDSQRLNPLLTLSPMTPGPYVAAFALYAAAIATNVWDFARRPKRDLAVLALLALLPGVLVVAGNVVKPDFFRIHGRHLYPAAPFFFLFLARGWVSLGAKIAAVRR